MRYVLAVAVFIVVMTFDLRPVQAFEVDLGVFQRHYQIKLVFLVAQEQVLGVAAGDLPAQGTRLLDREQRRVFHGLVRDAKRIESGE